MNVALVLTRACNLACGYCYTGDKVKARMSPDTAASALDFALERAEASDGRLGLSFFGGEPLLEWELLADVARKAREGAELRGLTLTLQVTTNGTLLDDDRLATLCELGVHVALSHDGTQRAHDTHRTTRAERGTHAEVDAALDRLLACGRPFDVITVVDPATLDDLADGVRGLLDRGVTRLTLNPSWSSRWSEAQLELLERQYEQVAAYVVAWFRRGRAVAVQPFDSALVLQASGELGPPHRCDAGRARLAVAPSGNVYGCARSVREDDGRFALGSLAGGLAAPQGCAEGCACASLEETGDPTTPGPLQRRHDALVAAIATRIVAALEKERVGRDTWRRTFDVRAPNELSHGHR